MTRFARLRSGSRRVGRGVVKGTKVTAKGTYKGWRVLRFLVGLPRKLISLTVLLIKYSVIFFLGMLAVSLLVVFLL